VNELEQEYNGRIDVIKIDISTADGNCEFQRSGATHIPLMLFFSASGKEVEVTDTLIEREQLKLKMESLLKQP
jgi:hypothetical protein